MKDLSGLTNLSKKILDYYFGSENAVVDPLVECHSYLLNSRIDPWREKFGKPAIQVLDEMSFLLRAMWDFTLKLSY
eukprot:13293218-Ditylum_brightwellii.AAC.1